MRIIGHFKDILKTFDGKNVFTLESSNYLSKDLISSLEPSKEYSIEIHEIKSKRTLQQNKYLWALLREIDVAMNGKPTDEYEIYIMALERANAKYELLVCTPQAENILKESFRAVKFIKPFNDKTNIYKVYIGSSQMNTKEMGILIDTVLDIANEVGIDTYEYWEKVLK